MHRAYAFSALAVALLGAGCGLDGVDPVTVDATGATGPDGGMPGDPDARMQQTSGLRFNFYPVPELPTPEDGDFDMEIELARFELVDVRAIGDSAPGDSRTTRASLFVEFDEDGTQLTELRFPDAPRGVYSLLIAEVASYRIDGTVNFGEDEVDFRIEDDPSMAITLNIDLKGESLDSGILELGLAGDLRKVPREVNWQSLSNEDPIFLDSKYSKIGDLRGKIPELFRLDD